MARIALLAALLFTALGCGGGDPCAGSRCPADDPTTPSEYQRCVADHQSAQNDRCYRQRLNYELCTQASQVCGADGRTDGRATLDRINASCRTARDSLICCTLGLTTCN